MEQLFFIPACQKWITMGTQRFPPKPKQTLQAIKRIVKDDVISKLQIMFIHLDNPLMRQLNQKKPWPHDLCLIFRL